MSNDEIWMRRALDLARRGVGLTRPNPPVGAVVVRNGRQVGEGFHHKAGTPHAEVHALRAAGKQARGATLYVTLEPCCTQGRTPPCTGAIQAAGIRRVVAAVRDPNPAHRGRGFRILRKAGIETACGVCEKEAEDLLAPFASHMTRGRPWVVLKLGATLDGRIADRTGRSRWITSPASRQGVQDLRRAADALLVGSETVRADNPSLFPRPARGRRPLRVVVDGRGRIPASARVLSDGRAADTLLAVSAACPQAALNRYRKCGAQVVRPAGSGQRVNLKSLMRHLHSLGVLSVLCEGGGTLAGALLRAKLVDEIVWFIAPVLLGGDARPALGGTGWTLDAGPKLTRIQWNRSGPDLVIRARLQAKGR
jgi:diaminohydroxyphosphoribosylaminopyrimidine deaminase/5-amino-6-(5-phosphoribosylamino)uracil reductase